MVIPCVLKDYNKVKLELQCQVLQCLKKNTITMSSLVGSSLTVGYIQNIFKVIIETLNQITLSSQVVISNILNCMDQQNMHEHD